MIRARTWVIIACVAAVAVTVGTRFWLGTDDWAGLGQWVGGLGSLAAVVAALWLAGAETRRERVREAERVRLHPYFVSGQWEDAGDGRRRSWELVVTNRGTDPVVDVEVLTLRTRNSPRVIPIGLSKAVLLPSERWEVPLNRLPGDVQVSISHRMGELDQTDVEIAFRDLSDSGWRRVGSNPPVPESGGLG
ncbi:hypothetical protein [Amycolatopsis sp. NPDC001319]|uniref:hypothetical protein n=1 Tax=unclassified Amycolatopsis TaxID=2618356 RepID=UPI0036BA5783